MAFRNAYQPNRSSKNDPRGLKRNIEERENEEFWFHKIKKESKTTDEIIQFIISEIEAQPIYYLRVAEICKHLYQIMKFFYRDLNVQITPFGSADTKLAVRNSDVDIFLDFGGSLPEPPDRLLRTLKNKVRKYGYFIRTIPIFARTPIVQCLHRNGLSCDLSFLNSTAVSNSQLIKFLMSLDERVRPLILIIKYLVKEHGLLETHALTSYSLVVLVLFFLQTHKNPIIPSISLLQSHLAKPNIIADWDTSFSSDTTCLPEINNKLSVTKLVHEFFQFYSTFEFGFYVICVYNSSLYLKTIFSDPNLLPDEFKLYKKNLSEGKSCEFDYKKFMCVQDPFNHCNNITRNTTQKSLVEFQQLCCKLAPPDQKCNGETEEKQYLFYLFDKKEEASNKNIKLFEKITIYVGQNISFKDTNCTEDDLRNEWAKNIFNGIIDILSKVMKCELSVSKNVTSSCENEEKVIYCEFHYPVLLSKKRNEVKSEMEFDKDLPVISQEEMVTQHLCETVLNDSEKIFLKFEICCFVKRGPTSFCVNFNSSDQKKLNKPFLPQVFKFIQNSLMSSMNPEFFPLNILQDNEVRRLYSNKRQFYDGNYKNLSLGWPHLEETVRRFVGIWVYDHTAILTDKAGNDNCKYINITWGN